MGGVNLWVWAKADPGPAHWVLPPPLDPPLGMGNPGNPETLILQKKHNDSTVIVSSLWQALTVYNMHVRRFNVNLITW